MTTILVIENEDFIRENILELLSAEGFSALGASDGLEGLTLYRLHRPDLILCDVLMPDFSGYDVLHAVRTQSDVPQVPFVFLSAESYRQDPGQRSGFGADHYLAKPFSIHQLLCVVYGFVDRLA
jgi:CheY-like chemotaxis protein